MTATEVGLSFGSNIGDKAGHIREAVARLEQEGVVTGLTLSTLYRTAPWGHVKDQDWFVNACAFGTTTLPPADLLARCKDIERRIGRTATIRWGPRVIDIDLLYYDDLALDSPGLTLPHKDMTRRAFVMLPLAEIRPGRSIGGATVAEVAATLDRNGIAPLDQVGGAGPRP